MFLYDGDGNRVKQTINGVETYFIGGYYEYNKTSNQVTKYYFAGMNRIAMRKYTVPSAMAVEYFLGDHLGSTSITTDANGAKVSEMRYKPWGEVRYSWTSSPSTTPAYELAKYTFTGQYSHMDDPSTAWVTEGFGLLFYVSRFYDPAVGRFIQADSIVPGGVQGLDRYAYVNNAPTRFTDPSGHKPDDPSEWNFSWKISLSVNLATSGIPINFYNPMLYPSPAQARYDQVGSLNNGTRHFNLCGDISLSMILETATGRIDTLPDIFSASPSTRSWNEGTSSYELGQQFAGSFPAGWSIIASTYGEVAYFEAGNASHTSYISNSPNGVSNINSPEELAMRLEGMLSEGHYVIAGVTQYTSGSAALANRGASGAVGHWAVVTGVSDQYVYINNPYTNRRERYTWAQFFQSWRYSLLELIPPSNRPGAYIPE